VGYEIKTAKRSELSLISGMAATEGWNPGLSDMQAFHAQDPEGFLIGWLDGKPVSCISVVRYPDNLGFLGFYIAIPEIRGTGLGLQIWEHGMAIRE
jgi:acetyltransferase (GNAT) family protein